MIAMALSCNPQILIADEPTTALDVTIQAQIVDLVKRLRDELGMAIIWITHDLGVVASIAHRVVVMYGGYIIEESDVNDLYVRPAVTHTRWVCWAACQRFMKICTGDYSRSKECPRFYTRNRRSCPFAPRCNWVTERCWQENPPLETVTDRTPRGMLGRYPEPGASDT